MFVEFLTAYMIFLQRVVNPPKNVDTRDSRESHSVEFDRNRERRARAPLFLRFYLAEVNVVKSYMHTYIISSSHNGESKVY